MSKKGYIKLETKISNIKEVLEIQGNEPSTDYDPYRCGMFNGLEMALAVLEQREPTFRQYHEKNWYKKVWQNLRWRFIRPKTDS